ncbi:MAG TPA: GGDEF and EAL domain-containing protein [Pseudacidobacterium sp.]|jgi:diguanylate cyclase (GGDEF)-like protein|nr:GGDEF and EAL domain-containing protein [Pseudacidobacterium sp.]
MTALLDKGCINTKTDTTVVPLSPARLLFTLLIPAPSPLNFLLVTPISTEDAFSRSVAAVGSDIMAQHSQPGIFRSRTGSEVRPTSSPYTLATRASSDGFWEWELSNGRVSYSSRWQAIAGLEAQDFAGTLEHWLNRTHPEDKPRLEAELKALAAGKSRNFHYEHRILYRDGSWRWVVARGIADHEQRLIGGSLTDYTERRTCDPLTGLPNRLFFFDRLERRLRAAEEKKEWNFAVISLNLERYRFLPESIGFEAADMLLVQVARRLTNAVNSSNLSHESLVARITDSEFSILLDGVERKLQALQIASAIQETLTQPFTLRKKKISIGAHLGVAMAGASYRSPEYLLRDADLAVFQARSDGRGKPVCFSLGMRERTLRQLQLESELRNAIETGELVLYYQPEVDLQSGRVISLEALVRWVHPERGLIPPSEFIPIAEETSLILPLGDWVLKEVCRQIVAWRATAAESIELRVSVNLSAKQFAQPDFIERVSGVLETSGVDAKAVSLEMTESSLMEDSDAALKTMQHLRRMGVGLHMDDFGTGYSSLNHLHRFPFDTLKIDRSFIQRVTSRKESQEIVSAIVHLAQSLKMNVVAEGIENADQLQWLQSLGCHFGQGYYFAKPLPASAISAIIASQAAGQDPVMLRFASASLPN